MTEPTRAAADSARVEQAIFTSVRSPMGEGYRIIAAGPGIRSDEKAEMTRRMPSHASLCGTDQDASALLAFPLRGGRHCVAISRYAGMEHTGRGGQRVHSHIVVLDQQDYHQFAFNPVRVHAALAQAVGDVPIIETSAMLEPLSLSMLPADGICGTGISLVEQGSTGVSPVGQGSTGVSPVRSQAGRLCHDGVAWVSGAALSGGAYPCCSTRAPHGLIDQALHVSEAMLQGERLLVIGSHGELDLLDRVMISLPCSVRRTLAVSTGLKHSAARRLHLCLEDRELGESQRAIRGQRIRCFDVNEPPAPGATPYEAWTRLLRQWFKAGREAEAEQLTASITEDASPQALARIASICADIDTVKKADQPIPAELAAKYARFPAIGELEQRLLQRLMKAVEAASDRSEESGKGAAAGVIVMSGTKETT